MQYIGKCFRREKLPKITIYSSRTTTKQPSVNQPYCVVSLTWFCVVWASQTRTFF